MKMRTAFIWLSIGSSGRILLWISYKAEFLEELRNHQIPKKDFDPRRSLIDQGSTNLRRGEVKNK
jgi:hypothetical protein